MMLPMEILASLDIARTLPDLASKIKVMRIALARIYTMEIVASFILPNLASTLPPCQPFYFELEYLNQLCVLCFEEGGGK